MRKLILLPFLAILIVALTTQSVIITYSQPTFVPDTIQAKPTVAIEMAISWFDNLKPFCAEAANWGFDVNIVIRPRSL